MHFAETLLVKIGTLPKKDFENVYDLMKMLMI